MSQILGMTTNERLGELLARPATTWGDAELAQAREGLLELLLRQLTEGTEETMAEAYLRLVTLMAAATSEDDQARRGLAFLQNLRAAEALRLERLALPLRALVGRQGGRVLLGGEELVAAARHPRLDLRPRADGLELVVAP